ncbi:N-acetylmuramoyl-L-alanine amidase [Rhodophyticola porphyridii]|uniref:N-acetylmuramoyl-L-alanine amidase n=1 Tax=Rhodophyticola porphyridii TaxID=1852017 RepID=A0A3L9Y2C3_9RHOB|nr:N-acetylmuramoyl-L-alanine amidase [Rhodophyticola porphyridii]RMA42994.1 N-acetylmuramoyl-L-alanine amidase [Rhodophyticola porphyridii]
MMRSPNFGERRDGLTPELVVLHYTAMQSCEAALRALCDPAREVSAHYLISETGKVLHLVDEDRRAWHAGAGAWAGAGDVNSRSIGIELANDGASPFPAPQMDALERLLRGILPRHRIPPQGVIAHSDMTPGRKIDPGPRFDWRRLALGGLSVWPGQPGRTAPDPARFAADAGLFGYPDCTSDQLLGAFRLRFRPWGQGPLDATDMGMMAELAARYGVDRSAARA